MTCLHCLDRIFIVYLHTILIGLQNLVFYPDVWRKLDFASINRVDLEFKLQFVRASL